MGVAGFSAQGLTSQNQGVARYGYFSGDSEEEFTSKLFQESAEISTL